MTKQSEVAFEWYPYANKTPIRNLHKSALNGKRVFLRVNYDIVWDARIIDDRRIRATVMDIRHILKQGAKTIIIVSHNGVRENFSFHAVTLLSLFIYIMLNAFAILSK